MIFPFHLQFIRLQTVKRVALLIFHLLTKTHNKVLHKAVLIVSLLIIVGCSDNVDVAVENSEVTYHDSLKQAQEYGTVYSPKLLYIDDATTNSW